MSWREQFPNPVPRPYRRFTVPIGLDSSAQLTVIGRSDFSDDVIDTVIDHLRIWQGTIRRGDPIEVEQPHNRILELRERNKDIRKLRAKGLTLEAIGDQYNLTRERIRQITSKRN